MEELNPPSRDPLVPVEPDAPDCFASLRSRTPARVLSGRAGAGYPTKTQLDLRQDHAAALDAVRIELDVARDLGRELVKRWGLFEVATQAGSKEEYLLRPDLGRALADAAVEELPRRCPKGADLQVVIGDGLSSAAVAAQVPALLPRLAEESIRRGWSFGQPFVVRYCRVGVLNEVGERLDPVVAVLLIGERPGLATAESLSAYMAYRPRVGHTDSRRNVISNIHGRGIPPEQAAARIIELAERMRRMGTSGVEVKEA